MIEYVQATAAAQLEDAKALFREYAGTLGCSPCLQNIEQELGQLPGEYGPPDGRLILAVYEGRAAGCAAYRKIGEALCEMRRMYLRPEFRGRKIGKGLAQTILAEARQAGCSRIRLYTLPTMKEAVSLYRSLGFADIPPYGEHIIPDAFYMEMKL